MYMIWNNVHEPGQLLRFGLLWFICGLPFTVRLSTVDHPLCPVNYLQSSQGSSVVICSTSKPPPPLHILNKLTCAYVYTTQTTHADRNKKAFERGLVRKISPVSPRSNMLFSPQSSPVWWLLNQNQSVSRQVPQFWSGCVWVYPSL